MAGQDSYQAFLEWQRQQSGGGNTPGANITIAPDGHSYNFNQDYQPTPAELQTQTDFGSQFDTPYMDYAKIGIGGINSVKGIVGTLDSMKNNKLKRAGMEQNQEFTRMARQDKTNFKQGVQSGMASAFA